MLLIKEIEQIAEQKQIAKTTIDKDWALGHFIDAIFSLSELKQKLVFKGGTCLKKCYLSDYRFSEDLDFTCTDKKFRLTQIHLNEVVSLLQQRVEMQTHVESLQELTYNDQLTGYEAVIKFWGSDHPKNQTPPPPQRWQTKIKIEIILYELMIFPTANKDVDHPYSDKLTSNAIKVPCYSIEEVLAEKMRALIQRSYTAPRDFYDIWYLSGHFAKLDYKVIVDAFHKKMAFKGHTFTGIEQLINPENDRQLSAAWGNSLSHQVSGKLPDYQTVRTQLLQLFKDLFQSG